MWVSVHSLAILLNSNFLLLLLFFLFWIFKPAHGLLQVLFVSERMVIGVGFDCNPMVFAAEESGLWYVVMVYCQLIIFVAICT